MTRVRPATAALLLLLPAAAAAGPDLSVSGFADVSAHWNANNPDSGASALRAYDRKADSFYLNAVHAAFSIAPVEGASVVVEVDGGSDADFNKNGQVDSLELDIQEAFVSYVHDGTGLGFKAGKAATFMGIEIIESPEDPTVTRGFLYTLAECGTHTGAFATWDEAELMEVSMISTRGSADAERFGVTPEPMRAILAQT